MRHSFECLFSFPLFSRILPQPLASFLFMESANMTIQAAGQNERNYGIDLLRIVAMFMVIILHVLGQGGVLGKATGWNYNIAWLFEIAAYGAVNIFAIISGYVGYRETQDKGYFRSILRFWVPVFLYSLIIWISYLVFKQKEFHFKELLRYSLPITSNRYWYASAYFVILLLKPLLNYFIRTGTVKDKWRQMIVAFAAFVLLYQAANFLSTDPFVLNNGYSALWLAFLYFIGGCFKRCGIEQKISKRHAIIGIFVCVLITWIWKVFLPDMFPKGLFVDYTSITVALTACYTIILFAKIKIDGFFKKAIAFFAPAAWGVYLIHVHPILYGALHDRCQSFANSPAWLMVLQVLGTAFAILIVCLLIEKLRLLLFRVLKIDWACDRVSEWVGNTVQRITGLRKRYE